MRIWDLPPEKLCRQHLLGEHAELHALWSILTEGKKGYAHHPETLRWRGKKKALFLRHQQLRREMEKRGYSHQSLLDVGLADGLAEQNELVDSLRKQKRILREKNCHCRV
jgi:hypothetical protein